MDYRIYDDSLADKMDAKVMLSANSSIKTSTSTQRPSIIQPDSFAEKEALHKKEAFNEEAAIYHRPPPSTFAAPDSSDQPINRFNRLPDLSRGIRLSYCQYALMLLSILGLFACLVVLGFPEFSRATPVPIILNNNIGFGLQSSPLLTLTEPLLPSVMSGSTSSQADQIVVIEVPAMIQTISAGRHEVTTTKVSELSLASSSPGSFALTGLANQTQFLSNTAVPAASTALSSRSQALFSPTNMGISTTFGTSVSAVSIVTTTLVTSVSPLLPSRRPVVPLTRSFTGPGLVGQILGGQ